MRATLFLALLAGAALAQNPNCGQYTAKSQCKKRSNGDCRWNKKQNTCEFQMNVEQEINNIKAQMEATPANARSFRIDMVSHGYSQDAFWTDLVKPGFDQAVKDMRISSTWQYPLDHQHSDHDYMADDIRRSAWKMADGIATTIPDADYVCDDGTMCLRDAIEEALSEPVPVVSFNSGLDKFLDSASPLAGVDSERLRTHIGQDEADAGKLSGQKMMNAAPRTKNALCLIHEAGNAALMDRCSNFCSAVRAAGASCTTASDLTGVGKDPNVANVIQARIKSGAWANMDAIMCLGPDMSVPVLQAVKAANKGSSITVASFDASSDNLKATAAGELAFVTDQNAFSQGYLPMVFLTLQADIGVMPGGYLPIYSGPAFIEKSAAKMKENVVYKNPSTALKSRDKIKIAYVCHGHGWKSNFWPAVMNGAKHAARDLGVDIEFHHSYRYTGNQADSQKLADLILDYGSAKKKNFDGLAFSVPNNDVVLTNAIKAVCGGKNAQVPCVSLNSGLDVVYDKAKASMKDDVIAVGTHVGMDEMEAGKAGGRELYNLGVTNLICFVHDPNNSAIAARCDGAVSMFLQLNTAGAAKRIDLGASRYTGMNSDLDDINWAAQMATRLATFTSGKPGKTGIMLASNWQLGRLLSQMSNPKNSGYAVGVVDSNAMILNSIINGQIDFALDQQPYLQGYLPAVLLTNYIQWGEMAGGRKPVYSGPSVIGSMEEASKALFYAEQGLR